MIGYALDQHEIISHARLHAVPLDDFSIWHDFEQEAAQSQNGAADGRKRAEALSLAARKLLQVTANSWGL